MKRQTVVSIVSFVGAIGGGVAAAALAADPIMGFRVTHNAILTAAVVVAASVGGGVIAEEATIHTYNAYDHMQTRRAKRRATLADNEG